MSKDGYSSVPTEDDAPSSSPPPIPSTLPVEDDTPPPPSTPAPKTRPFGTGTPEHKQRMQELRRQIIKDYVVPENKPFENPTYTDENPQPPVAEPRRFGSVLFEKRMVAAIDSFFNLSGTPSKTYKQGLTVTVLGTGLYGKQPAGRILPLRVAVGLLKGVGQIAVESVRNTVKLAVVAAYKVPMLALHAPQAIGYTLAALGRGAMMLTNLPGVMLGNQASKDRLSANWDAFKENSSLVRSHGKETLIAAGVIGVAVVAGVFIAGTVGVGATALGVAGPVLAPIIGAGHAAAGIGAVGVKAGSHIAAQGQHTVVQGVQANQVVIEKAAATVGVVGTGVAYSMRKNLMKSSAATPSEIPRGKLTHVDGEAVGR